MNNWNDFFLAFSFTALLMLILSGRVATAGVDIGGIGYEIGGSSD